MICIRTQENDFDNDDYEQFDFLFEKVLLKEAEPSEIAEVVLMLHRVHALRRRARDFLLIEKSLRDLYAEKQ